MFKHHWLCMSVMTIQALLQDERVRHAANQVILALATARGSALATDVDAAAYESSAMLDKFVKKAWNAARALGEELEKTDNLPNILNNLLQWQAEHKGLITICNPGWH